ncbi:phosphatase 2C-like domain-containing protein [Pilobolus umbonatus]|nr:phosphatase 2C-like domain-containing protein [Pilobolus umbonatus]
MRSHAKRIAATSTLLLRASRTPITNTAHIKPAISHTLSQYIHEPTQRTFTSTHYINNANNSTLTQHTLPDEEVKQEVTSAESFQFVAYAAWHPKTREKSEPKKELPYWKQQQKPGKVDAGEDAFFKTSTPTGLALGVADGVGGWGLVGVDPALFSWTLMDNAAIAAKNGKSVDAHQILDTAFHELRLSGKVAAGSSTACILNLSKTTGEMTTCNLGDSAFLLIRDQKIVYESPSQQHYFNCPYQLTVVPDTYPNRDELVIDLPKDADTKSFFLKDGDLILLATDGYFDNMYAEETLEIINDGLKPILEQSSEEGSHDETVTATIRSLAKTLTDKARRQSLNPKRLSPWAKAAQAHGSNYRGGKVDDITCIVTLVCAKEDSK